MFRNHCFSFQAKRYEIVTQILATEAEYKENLSLLVEVSPIFSNIGQDFKDVMTYSYGTFGVLPSYSFMHASNFKRIFNDNLSQNV